MHLSLETPNPPTHPEEDIAKTWSQGLILVYGKLSYIYTKNSYQGKNFQGALLVQSCGKKQR